MSVKVMNLYFSMCHELKAVPTIDGLKRFNSLFRRSHV